MAWDGIGMGWYGHDMGMVWDGIGMGWDGIGMVWYITMNSGSLSTSRIALLIMKGSMLMFKIALPSMRIGMARGATPIPPPSIARPLDGAGNDALRGRPLARLEGA